MKNLTLVRQSRRAVAAVCTAFVAVASTYPTTAGAQDSSTVSRVVSDFFRLIAERKGTEIMSRVTNGAHIVSASAGHDGSLETKYQRLSDLAVTLPTVPAHWVRQLKGASVRVSGPTAMFTADYIFLINGAESYCGHVAIVLLKKGDSWLIAHIAESQRIKCAEV